MVNWLLPQFKPLFALFDDIKNNRPFQGKYKSFVYDLPGGRWSGKTWANERLTLASVFFGTSTNLELFRYMTKDKDEMWKSLISQAELGDLLENYGGNKYELISEANLLRVDGVKPTDPNRPIKLGRNQKTCKYKIVYIDEFYEFKQDHYEKLFQSFRAYEYLLIIRSSNPWSELHWWVKDCYEKYSPNEPILKSQGSQVIQRDNRIVHWTNALINWKNLPDGIKERYHWYIKNDPLIARVVCYGLPGMIKGSVFGHLLPKVSALIQPSSLYIGGLDYGFKKDATSALLIGADGLFRNVNIIDEYYWDNYTMGVKDEFMMAKEIVNFYFRLAQSHRDMRRGTIIYCDYSEHSFITILNKEVQKQTLGIGQWLSFKDCKKPSIEYRIGKIKSLMAESRLSISLNCVNLLRELRLYSWDMNKVTLTPMDKDNHSIDALSYGFTRWWSYLENNPQTNNFI